MKSALKQLLFRILGKDPKAIVVSFASGDPALAARMFEEIRQLEPQRRHVLVRPEDGGYFALRKRFRKNRIGLAPVLFDDDPRCGALRRAAFLLAPTRILAYNRRLERHHLRLKTAIASMLFLRGVPLDRIFLRPKWLSPWKTDRSVYPGEVREVEGRPLSPRRRRIAVLTPYFPYPLAHGGAVRIFNLLREMAAEFDIFLFAFHEGAQELAPVLEHCARIFLVRKPRYREPRWSTLLPPEVHEYDSPAMRAALTRAVEQFKIEALQVEYTMLAPYPGDILVEHDVTFELQRQVCERARQAGTKAPRWDYWRWRRFEKKWVKRYRRVIVMSEQDRELLGQPNAIVIPNGVDLERFTPEIERPGRRLLFIGSFRHFPNIVAYRFFAEQILPRLPADIAVTVVAGPDPLLYWQEHTGLRDIAADPRIRLLEFVADVRPLYVETNLVLVPTLVSAGTNLKVLEAMAMDRAVLSTSCGCAGLGLKHGHSVWIADSAEDFAAAIRTLLADTELRQGVAAAGRAHVERNFGWREIGTRHRAMLRSLLPPRIDIRPATSADLPRITAIQAEAREAAQWQARDYLIFDSRIAVLDGQVAGFIVSRQVADREREILNVAVHPDFRRLGIASELLRDELARFAGTHFLEVRESNAGARQLYEQLGFRIVGERPGYYENPTETGIVMRIFS